MRYFEQDDKHMLFYIRDLQTQKMLEFFTDASQFLKISYLFNKIICGMLNLGFATKFLINSCIH